MLVDSWKTLHNMLLQFYEATHYVSIYFFISNPDKTYPFFFYTHPFFLPLSFSFTKWEKGPGGEGITPLLRCTNNAIDK